MTFVTGGERWRERTLDTALNNMGTVTDMNLVRVARPAPAIAFHEETRMKKIRVLIIDEHPAVCRALTLRLDAVPSVNVIASVCDFEEGLACSQTLRPDVILMEIKGKCDDVARSLRAITRLVADRPAGIIVLTSYLDEAERDDALKAGAVRYLLKDIDTERLVAEIEAVAGDSPAISNSAAANNHSPGARPADR